MRDGEADPTTCANCRGLARCDVVVGKASVTNAKVGPDDLLMIIPVARRLPRTNVGCN